MARALPRGAVDPPRLEPERVELRAQDVADLANALEFCVPLLMLTTRSSSARPSALCASMKLVIARSSVESAAGP